MENQTSTEDWRTDISDTNSAALKILDGDKKQIVFLDEGKKFKHSEFGTSIVFEVECNKEKFNFYVKQNNFSLLKQIKDLGKITGAAVIISRKGSKRSDTRYFIEKIE